jgi:cytochrome c oxidase subunit 2
MNYIYNDVGEKLNLYFQDEGSINAIGIKDVHDNIMYYLIIIIMVVIYGLYIIIYKNIINKYINQNVALEII